MAETAEAKIAADKSTSRSVNPFLFIRLICYNYCH
jgi:hypothetical protein